MKVDQDFEGIEELEIADLLDLIAKDAPVGDAVVLRDAAIDIRFLVENVIELLQGESIKINRIDNVKVMTNLCELTANTADKLSTADYRSEEEYESLLSLNRIAGELIENLAAYQNFVVKNKAHH